MSINRSLSGEPTFGCGKNALRFHCLGYALAAVLTTAAVLPQHVYSSEKTPIETPAPKRILILYTQRHAQPINQQWDQGILKGLKEFYEEPLAIEGEYFDPERLEDAKLQELWLEVLGGKYVRSPPDLVIPVHDQSAAFVMKNYHKLFPGTAVVFCSMSQWLYSQLSLDDNMTGVIYQFEYNRTVQFGLNIWPNARKLIVASGSGQLDRFLLEEFRSKYTPQKELDIEYWTGIPTELLSTEASQLSQDSLILYLAQDRDRDGRLSISTLDVAHRLSLASTVPVLGLFDTLLGAGIIGGCLVSPEEQGYVAGQIAARILKGEHPSNIPIVGLDMSRYVADQRQLLRFGIPESALPAGSQVLFREASIWQLYGNYISSGIAVLGLQMLIIAALLVNRRKRVKAESVLAERLRFESFLAEISSRLVKVGPEELSREIEFALNRVLKLFELDLAIVYDLSPDGQQLRSVASVAHAGTTDQLDEINLDSIAWLWSQMKDGQVITFSDVFSLPDEATIDKHFLMSVDLTAAMAKSLSTQDRSFGTVLYGKSSGNYDWDETVVQRLQILTEVFSSALAQAHSDEELALSQKNAQELSGRLLTAIEDERRHLAREMHDDVSQRLAVVANVAGKIEQECDQEPTRSTLHQLREQLIGISDDVHRISRRLHPSILDDMGLNDVIHSECMRISAQEGIAVDFRSNQIPDVIPKDLAVCLYRVAQEALRNAVKHSQSDRIVITLNADAENLYLTCRDFGRGLNLDAGGGVHGLGIASMQERVRLVHGSFAISSAPGEGTSISATIPLVERKAGNS